MAREFVTATMATTPERIHHAMAVVLDLAHQVDRLAVYVNGPCPDGLRIPDGVEVTFATDRDLADNGKFETIPDAGWHFTVDDDLHYPKDYVARTILGAEKYGRLAVVSWHGSTVRRGSKSYYKDRTSKHHCLATVAEDTFVHVPGTGVMAYHTSAIHLRNSDFDTPYMADLWMAYACQRARVPVVVLAHRQGWIRHRDIDHSQTIYERFHNSDDVQTWLVNRVNWALYSVAT